MNRLILYFILSISVCAYLNFSVYAQQTIPSLADPEIKNMSVDEILKRFGEPDIKRVELNGTQTWLYGKSVLIFTEGKVSAWANPTDLLHKEKMVSIRQSESTKKQSREVVFSRWINAWTPRKYEDSCSEILEEIFLQ